MDSLTILTVLLSITIILMNVMSFELILLSIIIGFTLYLQFVLKKRLISFCHFQNFRINY